MPIHQQLNAKDQMFARPLTMEEFEETEATSCPISQTRPTPALPHDLASLDAFLTSLQRAEWTPTVEQVAEVAAVTNKRQVGSCIQMEANRWVEAFGEGRASSVARHGVRLDLSRDRKEIPQHVIADRRSSPSETALLRVKAKQWVQQGMAVPIQPWMVALSGRQPLYHSPFFVEKIPRNELPFGADILQAQKEGSQADIDLILAKLRLVLNYKPGLNRYGRSRKFKQNGLKAAVMLIRRNDFLAYVDIQDAFNNVPLHFLMWLLCAFMVNDPESLKDWPLGLACVCLTFGVWSAPCEFILTLKVMLMFCARFGVRLSDIVDDILVMAQTMEGSLRDSMVLVVTLNYFGWRIKIEKLALIPSQVRVYGGMKILTVVMAADIPQKKWEKWIAVLSNLVDSAHSQGFLRLRQICTAVGVMQAANDMVYMNRLHMLHSQDLLQRLYRMGVAWDQKVELAALGDMLKEISKWRRPAFQSWRGKWLRVTPPDKVVTGDCSQYQLGCKGLVPSTLHLDVPATDPDCPPMTIWLPEFINGVPIRGEHSTICELAGACLTIDTYRVKNGWTGIHVEYLGDNICAESYVDKGGGRKKAQNLILRHFLSRWRTAGIAATMGFRSGKTMIKWGVDGLSRDLVASLADLEMGMRLFQVLTEILRSYGVNEMESCIDLFANSCNAQFVTFCARYPEVEATYVNALELDWAILPLRLYAFPPPNQLTRCVPRVQGMHPEQILLLVVPCWPSQPWWPILVGMSVRLPLFLPASSQTLRHPLGVALALASEARLRNHALSLTALVLSSSATRCAAFRSRLRSDAASDGERELYRRMLRQFDHSSPPLQLEAAASGVLQMLM